MKMMVCGNSYAEKYEIYEIVLVSLQPVFKLEDSMETLADMFCGYYVTRER